MDLFYYTPMPKISLILLIFISLGTLLYGDNLLYHENLDGDCTDLTLSINEANGRKEYTLTKTLDETVLSVEHIVVDAEGDTQSWYFQNYAEDLYIEASRDGNRISLIQEKGRRTKTEEYQIKDDSPWHQIFPFGMEEFVTREETERSFWFIQPQNLKLSSLRAVRKEEKTITVHGIREKAVEVEISINNWLAKFWKGLYLLRSGDGRYLFYEGILRKNLSRGTIELINENG